MVELYAKDSLLQKIFEGKAVTQSVFSRFLTGEFKWGIFNLKRVFKFQEDAQTRLVDRDIIALNDTLSAHNYTKKMPFIYRLWDHCSESYIDAMNLVVLHAKKALAYIILCCITFGRKIMELTLMQLGWI